MLQSQKLGLPKPSLHGVGPVVSEAVGLLVTVVVGITLVTLLVFAPRIYFNQLGQRESPAGQTELRQPGFDTYAATVNEYLRGLLQGDLGTNARGRSVSRELMPAAQRSLELMAVSIAVALPLGLAWGAMLASLKQRMAGAVMFGLSTIMLSLPTFVILLLGMELIASVSHRTGIRLGYVQGYGLDRHLVLPVSALALRGAAFMARALQVAQEEVMRQDWVRVARAKGLGRFQLWRSHVLPALGLPLLGSSFGMLRVMVGGLVIVDYLTGWGGLGRKMLHVGPDGLINPSNDTVVAGAAVLLILFFVTVDLLSQFAMRWVDPRVRP